MPGFDLAKNDLSKICEEGYRFELMLPEVRKGTGAFITVRGSKSKAVMDYARRAYNTVNQREKIAKRKGQESDSMTLEEAEDFSVELAAVRIKDWEGIFEDGAPVEFNEANAKRILKQHPWIREAIMIESDTLGNFVKM